MPATIDCDILRNAKYHNIGFLDNRYKTVQNVMHFMGLIEIKQLGLAGLRHCGKFAFPK